MFKQGRNICIYSGLYDKVQSIGHKTETDDIYMCYFLIEEECQEQYYQNYIGIPTYSNTRNIQEVESGNYISQTGIRTTCSRREAFMDTGKFKDNYNKNRKSKCFNYNVYRHMAKDCQKPKKEKETRKWYRYNKIEYLVKDCRLEKRMKN